MQFIHADADQAVADFTSKLEGLLREHSAVLWLVSGGSNIPLCVQIMAQLPEALTAKLTLLLTDERFGPVGHKDSNYQQLLTAGLQTKQARFIPTLVENMSLEELTARYAQIALEQFAQSDAVIAQFGMGADGHIAGILPQSLAAESTEPAASYVTADFVRMTLTFSMLQRCHTAYLIAYGRPKHPALKQLRDETIDLTAQPAQIVKRISDSYVYNDL